MSLKNTLVISDRKSPLNEIFNFPKECTVTKGEEFLNLTDSFKIIFDLTLISNKNEKISFLKKLSKHFPETTIISELSLFSSFDFIQEIPEIKGALSLAFKSNEKKREYFSKDDTSSQSIQSFLKYADLEGFRLEKNHHSFIYPKVISMIINEAYFAIEDDLATREDIDTAMKTGVNYPLGPFEWAKLIGTHNIINLLQNIYTETDDERYLISPLLKIENQQESSK